MALKQGSLGGGTLTPNIELMAYECLPPAIAASFTVSFCNKSEAAAKVRLAIGPGPTSKEAGTIFYEFDAPVQIGTPLERTALACAVGKKVFVFTNSGDIDVGIHGFEKE